MPVKSKYLTPFLILGRFTAELLAAESFEARFALLEKLADKLNFEGVTYTFFPLFGLGVFEKVPPVVMQTDAVSSDFIDHYTNGGLCEADFTVRNICDGNYAPLSWRESEQQALVSAEETHVIQIAREDYGIANALTIPTMPEVTRSMGIAGVTVFSSANDRQFALLKDNFDTISACSQIFHLVSHAYLDLHRRFIWPLFADITPKEQMMLEGLMKGQVVKQIADDASVTLKSAYRIIDGIRAKLGGISLVQLIHIATVAKLVQKG